jgi:WD40 repeat protein
MVVRDHDPTVEMVTAMLGGDPARVQFSILDEQLAPAHPVHRLLTVADLVDRPRGRKHQSNQRVFRRDKPGAWPVTHECWATVRGRAFYAAGAYSHVVLLWDLQARIAVAGPFAEIPLRVPLLSASAKDGPPPVKSIAIGEVEGRALLAAACDGRVRLWDIDTADECQAPELGIAVVTAVAVGAIAGRNVLVTGSKGGELTTWDVNRGEHLAAITLDEGIDGVWVVRNSDMICALTDIRTLHLLEFVEGSGD